MSNHLNLCEQFANILHGKGSISNGVCTVSLHRKIHVTVQGKQSTSIVPVGVWFESLDEKGNALNMGEIAILEEEIPRFMYAVVQQGIIVSALHNHWLYTNPTIMYIHIQSVEPPLNFAQKVAHALSTLNSYPTSG
ncbi:hypothetical protein JOC34_002036 [Virgibacillus halotolerans]|uniref:DUF1259 domain-containing protein n=1 Tax=Virgibacillus halotolerans TaxID=1071053 RepID=UPI001961B9B7|nr:DUF1259 domain-containing protein [Virgibacillus halotolerans]MBM7599668.1 hypothetical protein [Virgibacillus halotolerans]